LPLLEREIFLRHDDDLQRLLTIPLGGEKGMRETRLRIAEATHKLRN
jgi:hypothetical protein